MSFYERYAMCCKERGVQPTSRTVLDKIGCSRSYISTLSKTNKIPSGEIVKKASQYFTVSADFLLELIDVPIPIDHVFSDNELQILSSFRDLNPEGQSAANAMLNGLKGQGIYKNSDKTEQLA